MRWSLTRILVDCCIVIVVFLVAAAAAAAADADADADAAMLLGCPLSDLRVVEECSGKYVSGWNFKDDKTKSSIHGV